MTDHADPTAPAARKSAPVHGLNSGPDRLGPDSTPPPSRSDRRSPPDRRSPRGERRARLIWSLIAEPSDPLAQLLRTALGPVDSLSMARSGGVRDLLAALGGRLPADPSEPGRADPPARAERALARWRRRLASTDVAEIMGAALEHRLRLLVPGDDDWPERLGDLETGTPPCLWARGDGEIGPILEADPIALVGSRASTSYGEDCAADLAHGIALTGRTVLSGGAYGIDAAAHRGALAAGTGATVAVLAGGLDSLYPRGNAPLLEQIATEHLLISEAPPGTAPTRWRFLARNRLIAALTGATVVIEAAWRSGALSTARWADDLSRPVGAVPGPVTSAASAGCHRLIRERGAVLITDVPSALDLLPGGPAAAEHTVQDELDLLSPSDRRVLDAVPPRSRRRVQVLADDIGFTVAETQAALARAELLGLVETRDGWARRAGERRGDSGPARIGA